MKKSDIEMEVKVGMKASSLPKGGIYDVCSRYPPKIEGPATLISDIPELCEITSVYFVICEYSFPGLLP